MKNLYILLLLIYLFLTANICLSYEAGIEYDGVYVDYKSLNYDEWKNKASEYLEQARAAKEEKERKKFYSMAAGAYQTVINISPFDAEIMATLGHIYGKMNRPSEAKSFLDRGLNLEIRNPKVNYYYGIFEEDEKDFRKALKFYNYAYQYGMENNADLNLRLAVVNSKLGELDKAQFHYSRACELLHDKNVSKKIIQLEKLKK